MGRRAWERASEARQESWEQPGGGGGGEVGVTCKWGRGQGGAWADEEVPGVFRGSIVQWGRIMNSGGRIQKNGQDQMQDRCFPKTRLKWDAGAHSSVSHCGHPAPQAPSPGADTFLHYRTSKVRTLRAARLERLVRELVSGDLEQDPGFVPAFLATHRVFVPTARVLDLLLPPPPPPLPPGSVPTGDSHVPTPDLHPDTPLLPPV